MSRRHKRKVSFEKVLTGGIILLIISLICSKGIYTYTTGGQKNIVINKLEVKRDKEKDKYLVMTEKSGVFENTDSFWRLKFNSSDLYNQLEAGQEYTIRYYGWRFPLFSVYPNIYKVEKVE